MTKPCPTTPAPDVLRVLFVGDVVGTPGLRALEDLLPRLRARLGLGYVVVNGENSLMNGRGISENECRRILAAGADCITGGNHSFAAQGADVLHAREPRLLRPMNYPRGAEVPGRGSAIIPAADGTPVAVFCASGQLHMGGYDNPWVMMDRELPLLEGRAKIILVDFHAEATSEKIAMGWHLDGRATAVVGTHTHVATADARILPGGTAYITDLGMTGPHDSVIGVRRDVVVKRLCSMLPARFVVAQGDVRLNGLLLDVDRTTGRPLRTTRLELPADAPDDSFPPDWLADSGE